MKSIIALTKNELIKLYKQWSFRILTLLFALLVVCVPFISYFSEKATADYYDGFDAESIPYYLQSYEENMAEGDYFNAARAKASADALQYFIDLDLGRHSGEYETYYYPYRNSLELEYYFELQPYSTLFDTEYIYHLDPYLSFYEETYGLPDGISYVEPVIVTGSNAIDISPDLIAATLDIWSLTEEDIQIFKTVFTEEKYKELTEKAKENRLEIEKKIDNFTITVLYWEYANDLAEITANHSASLAEYRESYQTASSAVEKADFNYYIRYHENEIELNSVLSSALEILIERESPYDGWESKTLDMMYEASNNASNCNYHDEINYYPENHDGLSYADYVKEQTEKYETVKLAMEEGLYSLEHEIPLNGSFAAMAKYKFETQITLINMVLLIILAVMAGYIFAFEYSTGTIRLLLIRPQSRDAICLSKILAVLISGTVLTVFSLIVLFVGDGLLFGFSGFSVNSIYVYDGKIHEIAPIVRLLIILAQDTISVLPMIMFSFLLSILFKRSPLAIAATLIWNVAVTFIQRLCTKFYTLRIRFFRFTPLPYLQLSYFRVDPTTQYFYYYDILTALTEGITQDYIMHSRPWLGTFYLVSFTAIFTYFCFWAFRHQQIKN